MNELKGNMTHPDSEVLAEFRAGLIAGRHGARISAHLAACERCAGLCDQLTEISALLAAVPATAMPEAVAHRLDGVLAAEAAHRDDAERAVGDSSRDRAPSPRPRRRWDFRLVALRVLAPAAAVAVLAAGGYGLSRIGGSSTASEASGTAASSPATAPLPQARAAVPSSAATSRPVAIPAHYSLQIVTSQTNYLRATLRQQLAREMKRYAEGVAGPPRPASAQVKGCVLRVIKDTRPVIVELVETARFQGQPAIVIVAASGRHDVAWVTTSTCSDSSDHVLAMTTLPGTYAP
ncbi:MAG TPA: hypothetical protein VK284_07940 [Streptosporangiaceae bacterium]|nr:hypothetical protein [Streptosporangiaceae bacterium]HLN71259.1 hypothetical protein [Streptosporangiaceae bacterium]